MVLVSDGSRFKVKGNAYREIAHILNHISYKQVVLALANGTIDEVIASIPGEFTEEIVDWRKTAESQARAILRHVSELMAEAPTTSRKDFALWATNQHKEYAPYLFAMLDGRDLMPMIYKRLC